MSVRKDDVTLTHVLTHPIRYAIAKELAKGRPLYIQQLTQKVSKTIGKVDRKIISFHLMKLEENGLIDSDLDVKKPPTGNPVVVRYSKLTPKASELLSKIKI